MLYMFHTHVAGLYSKCFINDLCCIQVFLYCKCFVFQRYICSESHGGMVLARGRSAASRDRQMGCTTRLGSCRRDVLVLIRTPESCPRGERMGSGGRSGEHSWACRAGQGRWERGMRVGRGKADGDGRVHAVAIWRNGRRGRGAAACMHKVLKIDDYDAPSRD
jgi:hypothetical protein